MTSIPAFSSTTEEKGRGAGAFFLPRSFCVPTPSPFTPETQAGFFKHICTDRQFKLHDGLRQEFGLKCIFAIMMTSPYRQFWLFPELFAPL